MGKEEYKVVLMRSDGNTCYGSLAWLKTEMIGAETLSFIRKAIEPLILNEAKRRILKVFEDGKHHRRTEIELPGDFWMERQQVLSALIEKGVLEQKRGGWLNLRTDKPSEE